MYFRQDKLLLHCLLLMLKWRPGSVWEYLNRQMSDDTVQPAQIAFSPVQIAGNRPSNLSVWVAAKPWKFKECRKTVSMKLGCVLLTRSALQPANHEFTALLNFTGPSVIRSLHPTPAFSSHALLHWKWVNHSPPLQAGQRAGSHKTMKWSRHSGHFSDCTLLWILRLAHI